jgi:predicted esterase
MCGNPHPSLKEVNSMQRSGKSPLPRTGRCVRRLACRRSGYAASALITLLVCCFAAADAAADEPANLFQGEWRTTEGVVKLEQKGNEVTGTYGAGDKFTIKGRAAGKSITFDYTAGQVKGKGQFTIVASPNAFKGNYQIPNVRQGQWNGWRPDPTAPADKLASFAGLWLTDLGLMELRQTGAAVEGKYALRGTSSIEGKASGRRLEFRFKNVIEGSGWFDLAPDGKTFSGASNTDRYPGWFGWNGRPAPEFSRHTALVPGQIVDGSSRNLLTYSIRAPEGFKADSPRKWPTVVILHGSNMNGRSYVATIAAAWPDIARDYILLGINGETPSNLDANPAFNYTYVNYMGHSTYKGFPGTDRESPALVYQAMGELKEVYPIEHYLVGGHSQGGFLTYVLLMNFPESIAGAFPISCGLLMQCEPDVYSDQALRAAQRKVPLAIIHGKNDGIMGFGAGQYAASLFGEAGWPAFRFFTDENAAHMFGRLPVGAAIRWLEAQSSSNPATLLDFAAKRMGENGYRDAIAALDRAGKMKLDDAQKRRLLELDQKIDAQAAAGVAKYLPLIKAAKHGTWIDEFLAFRDDFEFAPAARDAMTAFAELRSRHDAPAKKAFLEARQLFQGGKQDDGYGKYREIVQQDYASPLYRIVKRALDERK